MDLVDLISQATANGTPLLLDPMVYLTRAGYAQYVQIGPKGLAMLGQSGTIIRRPPNSIGQNPLKRTDDNYGLYLLPAQPTPQEIAALQFTPSPDGTYQYAVLIRGVIELSDFTLDCNMGQQGLSPGIPDDQIEHSAMLAFSGSSYVVPNTSPKQVVLIAFERVTISNVTLANGGFADDVWISPARGVLGGTNYDFRPNIDAIAFNRVKSAGPRINERRGSVTFTGLSRLVSIGDCILDSLYVETDDDWSTLVGPLAALQDLRSRWAIVSSRFGTLHSAAKGGVVVHESSEVGVGKSYAMNFASGTIRNSSFAVTDVRRVERLQGMRYESCKWQLFCDPDPTVTSGIELYAEYGEGFDATFVENTFSTTGPPKNWFLIGTSDHDKPANHGNTGPVEARFIDCTFQVQVANPNIKVGVANLVSQGDYWFSNQSLQGLVDPIVYPLAGTGVVQDVGNTTRYTVP